MPRQGLGHYPLHSENSCRLALARETRPCPAGKREQRNSRVLPLQAAHSGVPCDLRRADAHDHEIGAQTRLDAAASLRYPITGAAQPLTQQSAHQVILLMNDDHAHGPADAAVNAGRGSPASVVAASAALQLRSGRRSLEFGISSGVSSLQGAIAHERDSPRISAARNSISPVTEHAAAPPQRIPERFVRISPGS